MLGRLLAALGIFIGWPVHVVVGVCIWLMDGPPVLFRARRLGRFARVFELLKYRTMRVGCPRVVEDGGKVVVRLRDSRVTAVGGVLRCGIDELPQVVNVVRGEMAWIGPRPDEPWILPWYGPTIVERLSRLPGLTGLAQVLDARHLSAVEGYALDVWYCRNRSVWLDLWILICTPLYILGWHGIGHRRLSALRGDPRYVDLLYACEREFALFQEQVDSFSVAETQGQ